MEPASSQGCQGGGLPRGCPAPRHCCSGEPSLLHQPMVWWHGDRGRGRHARPCPCTRWLQLWCRHPAAPYTAGGHAGWCGPAPACRWRRSRCPTDRWPRQRWCQCRCTRAGPRWGQWCSRCIPILDARWRVIPWALHQCQPEPQREAPAVGGLRTAQPRGGAAHCSPPAPPPGGPGPHHAGVGGGGGWQRQCGLCLFVRGALLGAVPERVVPGRAGRSTQ